MHNRLFEPPVPTPSGFLFLNRVWEVAADATYDNPRPNGYPVEGWLLVRTLAGEGLVEVAGGRRLACPAGSLLLLAPARLRRHACRTPPWIFWWFECGRGSTLLFPVEEPAMVPALPGEAGLLKECARLLKRDGAAAGLASALLLQLCHRWRLAGARAEDAERGARKRVREVMRQMQAAAGAAPPVPELARQAGLSAGRFRCLFRELAGCPPKSYAENLRLAKAVAWLREGEMKLAEIAARLGYSSPFHFSRAFSRRYGRPPSAHRPPGVRGGGSRCGSGGRRGHGTS
ncbi:MAG: helix-turn-helix transcriptional regulator [Lentisphaeria bacterium]|jgi:AraC-like DNA-binding protein